jgi:hypothetical protein
VASNDVTLMPVLMKTRDAAPEPKHADKLTEGVIFPICFSLCPASKEGIVVYIVQYIHTAAVKIRVGHRVESKTYVTRIFYFNWVDLHIERILP